MNNSQMKIVAKAVIVGSVAGLITSYTNGDGIVDLLGMSVSPGVLMGVTVGGASLVGGTLTSYLTQAVPSLDTLGSALRPVVVGGASLGVLKLLGDVEPGVEAMAMAFGVGAVSEMSGAYVTDKFVAPMLY